MQHIKCKECGLDVDTTTFKSPKQVKYHDKCRMKVRSERAKLYYKNRKSKCSCGANNSKHKTRCWKCGRGLKEINLFQKPKSAFRQLEILI